MKKVRNFRITPEFEEDWSKDWNNERSDPSEDSSYDEDFHFYEIPKMYRRKNIHRIKVSRSRKSIKELNALKRDLKDYDNYSI